VVAGLLAGDPARLEAGAADAGEDRVPRLLGPADVEQAEAAGMGQAVADGDRLLAAGGELGEVARHRVVERQEAALPELGDGDGGERLARGEPEEEGVGRHRPPRGALADRQVGDRLAAQRDVELAAEMVPGADAVGEEGAAGREVAAGHARPD
jgi:hypothetical protein